MLYSSIQSLLLAASLLPAADASFSVRDADDLPLAGATVTLGDDPALKKECVTDSSGTCRIAGIAPGRYHLVAALSGFATVRREAVFGTDLAASFDFTLAQAVHVTESITVSPTARDTFESFQPAAVLGGEELQQRLGATLGATLGSEPGVNVRSFGAGNARPVIRGLDGDRVLILENGVRTGDLSFQSGDHGVTLDPAAANRIEVVRGPATLLYGASAIGGVINVISDEIPRAPISGTHGYLNLDGGSSNGEAGGSGTAVFGRNGWSLRGGGSARRTRDYDTPIGQVPNSQSDMVSLGSSVGYADDKGFVGAAYNFNRTTYGIPYVESGNITLNPRRHRADLRGERRFDGSFIEGVKVELGYRNYSHTEFEGEDVGTQFFNKYWEGNVALNHAPLGSTGIKGTIGFQGATRDYESIGEEALAPPTTQHSAAAYFYEERPFGHVTLQLGARLDHTSFDPDASFVPDRDNVVARRFTNASGSFGALAYLREDVTLALSLARAARNPSLEELYNVGAHPGNNAFEIGDPGLGTEVGRGADLSLRWRRARFSGELTVFRNDIDDYIFPLQSGEIEDELPVIRFTAADARLQGFEAHVDAAVTGSLWLELGGDGVHGELRSTDDALPRIPPYRGWAGLRYERKGLHLEGEVRAAARQDRVYGEELPTAGYTVVNFHGSYTLTSGTTAHTLTVRLDNAGDELYRNHLSYLKELAPEMGRSFRVVYGVRF